MMLRAPIPTRWRFAAGCALLGVLGSFPFVHGARVPLLGWIDLAIHEFGHLAAGMLPDVATAVMGNGTQTAVPLGLATVFLWRQRDWLGTVLCVGWAASTLQDASVYIGDAPFQRLALIGGYHDWAFALGELGLMAWAEALARAAWAGGLLLWVCAVAGALVGPQVEPVLREQGVRGALAFIRGGLAVPAGARDGVFYGSMPERASAKRSSLS